MAWRPGKTHEILNQKGGFSTTHEAMGSWKEQGAKHTTTGMAPTGPMALWIHIITLRQGRLAYLFKART